MSKQAGGRPAKSGARRELKTFRLVPNAIARLERLASERGGSTSDVLNELLLDMPENGRARHLEVLPVAVEASASAAPVTRFRVLSGGNKAAETADTTAKLAHTLERLRDGLGGTLTEIESLMSEQLSEPCEDEYASGFKAGMLEALETAYALLQAELMIAE